MVQADIKTVNQDSPYSEGAYQEKVSVQMEMLIYK